MTVLAALLRWKFPRNWMVSGTKQDNLLTIDQSGKRWLRRGKRRIVLGIAFQGYSCAEYKAWSHVRMCSDTVFRNIAIQLGAGVALHDVSARASRDCLPRNGAESDWLTSENQGR